MKIKCLCIILPMFLHAGASFAQASDCAPQQSSTATTSALIDKVEFEYKKIDDIDRRLSEVKNAKIEDVARAIAEVDEWLFAPNDEEAANKKIENEIEKLRVQIEAEVGKLLNKALSDLANDNKYYGRDAQKEISEVNSLLSFYPAPKTSDQRVKLGKITSNILNASQRIEEIRRLRYNEWAISYIKSSLEYYRHESRIVGVDLTVLGSAKNFDEAKEMLRQKLNESKFLKNKDNLVNACIAWLGPIDPAFLEPVVMDLYNYVYGLTRDAVGGDDVYRINLASGLANPKTKRKTPKDF